jgi:hypothetical protein
MHNRGRKFPRLERECVSFWASSSLAAYARQAKNMELEGDALEIRMRVTQRLDRLPQVRTLGASCIRKEG